MQWTQHMNTHKEVPDHLNIHDLSQVIQPRTGYEHYQGYQKLLAKIDSKIRDRETEGIYKRVVNKKIDYTFNQTFAG